MKWIDYKYVDFQSGKFDYSVCEKVPYTNQLDEHPHVPSHVLEKMKEIIPQDVQDAYLNNGYYFLNDSCDETPVQQCDVILSEDFEYAPEIFDNSASVIKKYLESFQGYFTFLLGNNQYRPKASELFRHAHSIVTSDGIEKRHTFTVIYPIDIVEEQTEKFKIFYTNHTPWVENNNFYNSVVLPYQVPVPESVCEIPFPKENKALLIYFNSVNGIHWVDGLNDNNYLCHVFDAATIREQLNA